MLLRHHHHHQGPARAASAAPAPAAAAAPAAARACAARLQQKQQQHRQRRRGALVAADATGGAGGEGAGESFGDAVKRVAKRVQGALPVIGLLSRLASPEGGFDGANSATYAEFSRAVYNSGEAYSAFSAAAADLEKAHGRPASSRYLLLALWMADQGAGGVVAPRDVVAAMRRLRVTGDMEIEIDRFVGARDAALAKYSMVERPPAPAQARAELGVDAVSAVALGLKDGAALEGADADNVAAVVSAALKVPAEVAAAAAAARGERSLSAAAAGPAAPKANKA